MSYDVASSEVFPVTPEVAFDAVLAAPLEELFVERAGPIPPVVRSEGQSGDWAVVGQTRTIVLADGSTNTEALVRADRPHEYGYRLTEFTGPLKALVSSVDGGFSFAAEGGGTRVTWHWTLHPTNRVTGLVLPVFAVFWRASAKKMWARLGSRL
ncbi:SRPBCC family protein [Nocardioides stalactiti]|uniref:SRPBCC family protein n=1 Tax=Nocardioides stalactiti TaxID=2755356 RepID=UPI001603AB16|nr:SRPBCC family protein [Nocardioides stalactiti]